MKLDTGNYILHLQVDATGGRFNYTFPHVIYIADCSHPVKSTRANWYFGQYAGIRFYNNGKVLRDLNAYKNSPPKQIHQINSFEGTISLSDTAGNLLFYGAPDISGADLVLYDKNYQKMTGTPLHGDYSASQGMIAIPHSTKPYINYLFHTNNTQTDRFKYSKIDLSQTSVTQGAVTNINTVINDSAGSILDNITEAITALKACNDSTYWIVIGRTTPAACRL